MADAIKQVDTYTIEVVKKVLQEYASPIENHFPNYHITYIEEMLDDLVRDTKS